jgi:predicted nucleic acid-binding protein
MTVLIDSWAWIEYWKGGEAAARAAMYIEGAENAVISSVNLAEVYFWVFKQYGEETAEAKSRSMLRRSHVIAVDIQIATNAAKLKAEHKLGLADSFVLATARSADATLVTGDPDLRRFKGVAFLAP